MTNLGKKVVVTRLAVIVLSGQGRARGSLSGNMDPEAPSAGTRVHLRPLGRSVKVLWEGGREVEPGR